VSGERNRETGARKPEKGRGDKESVSEEPAKSRA